jgi:hypothetical protein
MSARCSGWRPCPDRGQGGSERDQGGTPGGPQPHTIARTLRLPLSERLALQTSISQLFHTVEQAARREGSAAAGRGKPPASKGSEAK